MAEFEAVGVLEKASHPPSKKSANQFTRRSLTVAAHWANMPSTTPVQCSRTSSASGSDAPYNSQVRVNIDLPPQFSQNTHISAWLRSGNSTAQQPCAVFGNSGMAAVNFPQASACETGSIRTSVDVPATRDALLDAVLHHLKEGRPSSAGRFKLAVEIGGVPK